MTTHPSPATEPGQKAPRSFLCPLTLDVMVDPVIDGEGNTFERRALLQWLSHYGVSPISRQPLNPRLVVPNFALRDTIHEVMGEAWVVERTKDLDLIYIDEVQQQEEMLKETQPLHYSRYRGKMDCFLKKLSEEVGGGMKLALDENGVCMFNCEAMNIILEVPRDAGNFFIYTIVSVPTLREETKDMLLELNRLQNETRGGTLSIKKYDSGRYDVFFSYSDRLDEIAAGDFCNIVPNFIETAARLKTKLLLPTQPFPTSLVTSQPNNAMGMTTKFV